MHGHMKLKNPKKNFLWSPKENFRINLVYIFSKLSERAAVLESICKELTPVLEPICKEQTPVLEPICKEPTPVHMD
jgi:hypothetical protein